MNFQPNKTRMRMIRLCMMILTTASISALHPLPLRAQTPSNAHYEEDLLRLSEVLGSLHFLTLLCDRDDGLIWQDQMSEILTTHADTTLEKALLTARFNAGFESFQSSYRVCTQSAETSKNRFFDEAQKIIQTLTNGR